MITMKMLLKFVFIKVGHLKIQEKIVPFLWSVIFKFNSCLQARRQLLCNVAAVLSNVNSNLREFRQLSDTP